MSDKKFAATVLTGAGALERQQRNPKAEIIPVEPPDLSASLSGVAPAAPPDDLAPMVVPAPVVPEGQTSAPRPRFNMRQSFTDARAFMQSLAEPPEGDASVADAVYERELDAAPRIGFFARWRTRFQMDRKLRGTWWAMRYALRPFRKSVRSS